MFQKEIIKILKINGGKAIILKYKHDITEEQKEKIRENLKEKGYANKSIDYEEFLQLYEPYKKEMSEKEFASIIGISGGNYRNIKYGRKAIILKYKRDITEEQKEKIRKNLNEKGYANKLINYEEFLQLYKPYKKEISEIEFASIISVSEGNYRNIKYGRKAIILKNKITEERKEEIRENLKKNGYTSKSIDYKEFLQLYEPYKEEMTKRKFAEILYISQNNFGMLRFDRRVTILKENKNQLERIKYQIKSKNGYYSKEELEKLCKKYNVTMKEIINELFNHEKYLETLEEKGRLYFGNCEIDREFQERNANKLLSIVNKGSSILNKRFNSLGDVKEDIASDTLLYILKNKGDIVLNSLNDEMALEYISIYVYHYEKNRYLTLCRLRKNKVYLDDDIKDGSKETYYSYFKAKDNTEEIVEEREERTLYEKNIMGEMKQYYDSGMNSQETIAIIMKKYNMSRDELMDIVESELSKKRNLKKDKTGKIYLGEEL